MPFLIVGIIFTLVGLIAGSGITAFFGTVALLAGFIRLSVSGDDDGGSL